MTDLRTAAGAGTRLAARVGIAVALAGCAPAPPRNLVLICVDTLRADHLGAYGYHRDTSPRLDALAAAGTLFGQVQSASNWTVPAVATLVTGLYPLHHGAVVPGERKHLGRAPKSPNEIVPEARTLAERLRERGFATFLVSGNPYLTGRFEDGFEEVAAKSGDAAAQMPRLLSWLDARDERPFFLYWQIMDLHQPIDPPLELARRYAPDAPAGFPEAVHQGWNYGSLTSASEAGFAAYRELRIALYDGALRHVDEQIGRLLDRLAARGLAEQTLIVVVADHGEEFWDHWAEEGRTGDDPRALWGIGHGHSMYQEVLHVPMIVAGRGVARGRRDDCPASLADVAPTVLARLAVPHEGELDGRVLPLRRAESGPCRSRPIWSEAPAYGPESVAVRIGTTKLISRAGVPDQLFDLAADPRERTDLAAVRTDEATAVAALVARRRATAGRRSTPAEFEGEELEALRALGYLP